MKQILCCAMLLLGSIAANACDVCGASSGNQGLGILPQFYRNFAGLQYQYRSFGSLHQQHETGLPQEASDEQYQTIQAWGRYGIGNTIQLFAFVPYHINTQSVAGVTSTSSGLGDVSVLAMAKLINSTKGNTTHLLFAGAGVKAPTGLYAGTTTRDRDGLPNMQPGTGSWDFMANANYTISHGNVGINTEAAYTFTTPNSDDYKYGNRLSTAATGFYRKKAGNWTLMPALGMKYEYTLHDYDNYTRKWLNDQTGGTMVYGTAGLQVYHGRMGLQLGMDLPLAQNYAGGNVTARYKATSGLLFMF
jgi:hypothetical protein